MTKPTPILESELRATIRRHNLLAALIDANATLYTRNRDLQGAEDERRAALARMRGEQWK